MKPADFPEYMDELRALRSEFPGIAVYTGLEVDFIPGLTGPSRFSPQLDYTIGSIHFVDSFEGRHWEIDNTLAVFREGLEKIFGNNIRDAVTRYLELTRQMVVQDPPDVVGHLDKIKIHNTPDPYFDESETWYRDEVDKTLQTIKEADTILEVNTRGLYKKKSPTTYPSPWILERAHGLDIRITLSSDAHHPADLIREFQPTARMLNDIGFKHVSVLESGIWKQLPFNEHGLDH